MAKTGIKNINSNYVTPIEANSEISISSTQDTFILETDWVLVFDDDIDNYPDPKITITYPAGETRVFTGKDAGGVIPIRGSGVYSILYDFRIGKSSIIGDPTILHYKVLFSITVAPNFNPLPKWNIRSVIDRVLNLAEPHLQSVSPRYKLDPAQAAEFENILAPEFAFTKCTLKEILDQIGGFIHGIPRLIRGESGEMNTIHYDMLGGTDEALISSENIRYITELHSQNIENYVTELDSTVDNLVNTLDSGEGALTEPYAGGFKSVRSEEAYARIEEGNMIISTSLPIYSVQKLEVIDPNNKVGDITAYVFEGAEYGRLSSFD